MKNLDIIIEALLFVKTEPLSKKKIAELLKTSENSVIEALNVLREKLGNRGVRLLINGDEVALGTAIEASEAIESVLKEELSRDLGKAGLETISIVLYKNPVTKNEIDFIRGVNSQFILRNLLIRGLIERTPNPNGRSSLYRPTFGLLRFIGVENIHDLPDYGKIVASLKDFETLTETSGEETPEPENAEENKVAEAPASDKRP